MVSGLKGFDVQAVGEPRAQVPLCSPPPGPPTAHAPSRSQASTAPLFLSTTIAPGSRAIKTPSSSSTPTTLPPPIPSGSSDGSNPNPRGSHPGPRALKVSSATWARESWPASAEQESTSTFSSADPAADRNRHQGWRRFSKGWRRAAPNLGDVFSDGLARGLEAPLKFPGHAPPTSSRRGRAEADQGPALAT